MQTFHYTHKPHSLSRMAKAMMLALLAAVLFFAMPVAVTQAQDTTTPPLPRTITVVGEGKITVEPDIAEATIGVEVARPSAREATDEVRQIMDTLVSTLQEQGVAAEDIQTSNFSISADRYGPEGLLPDDQVQYRVNNSALVKIRDLENIGAILDAAIDAGANSIYGVTFRVEDTDALQADAMAAAIESAGVKAERLAELTGVTVGDVVSVSEVVGGSVPIAFDMAMSEAAMGGGVGPINPGAIEFQQRVQVVYAIAAAQ